MGDGEELATVGQAVGMEIRRSCKRCDRDRRDLGQDFRVGSQHWDSL